MYKVDVYRLPMGSPDDLSALVALLDNGSIDPQNIIAVLAKTEGNGCVNDFTRGFTTLALKVLLSERLGLTREEVGKRVALVMSGGTEGVMTPHMNVFVRQKVSDRGANPNGEKRLVAGIAFTRDFLPEEQGRMAQVLEVARAVREAMADAGITDPADVHFVQIKCPLLTADRIEDAHRRGQTVAVHDTYKSMGYNRGASALGAAVALGQIKESDLSDEMICNDWSIYSDVASTSAGVEILNCEIIVMGNSTESASELVIGHDVMKDGIDMQAVLRAMKAAGLKFNELPGEAELAKIVNVLAKAEARSTGEVRGRRNTMLDDSDINHTRSARAVVNAVIASITGDPMVYVSGGAEHQGPDGGGPVAVIARA
ncbi:ring-opening amidohydrolase [Melaminivora alkalimesophila]|uniref:cyanuric acid amidohydrolase n=1 Tax=Melaminivora alkalimesophila TaxID=1165852 RepID=UPI00058DFEDD|nr:ring-opening amidohydrolase [Melaminivora alkalimesophila]